MDLKSELLKSIWYAFTSLDAEKCGKVSKSQLKVLSHNLYTVLNIPHDPVALEEHFQDDDDGPVSNHGYIDLAVFHFSPFQTGKGSAACSV
uniref:SWAP70 N-terminal EF-hand domain-containing protein n=1 Tax=Oryzias latipes TaxID=8090 RepID=A0A3B3IN20_ORYLA